jgi:16S rRNA (cytosine967-C5)-methyltransferase
MLGAVCTLAARFSVATAFSMSREHPGVMRRRHETARMHQDDNKPWLPLNIISKKQDDSVATVESTTMQSTARLVAARALTGEKKGQTPLQRLESDPSFRSIGDQRDRSFARLLVTTVERRLGQIDLVLEQCQTSKTRKRLRRDDLYVQACLRVGAAQLLFLGVAPHAAVKETIDLLRQEGTVKVPESKIKYANAVLRRISREASRSLSATSSTDNIAPWLIQEWKESWGSEATVTIAESFMQQSSIYLSVNYPPGTSSNKARLEQEHRIQAAFGEDCEILPHGSIRVGGSVTGAVNEWPLYDKGLWWVQDASATLPAIALYNTLSIATNNGVSNMHVVDLCASPGGKTAQLVSLGFGNVTAVEISPRRCRRLTENLKRLNMEDRCTVCIEDGSKWLPDDDSQIHGVLVDVPCSATGTGSKRPDVLRRDKDLGNLLEVQEKLAQHCADNILTSGSIMVYATCSILKQESEDQVNKLLQRGRNGEGAVLETVPFRLGEIPGFDEAIDNNGWLRVLPGTLPGSLSSCDGFFVARLRRLA